MKPFISICVRTFNHEKYISDAIESFLMQKTDFPFEIILHDDASTDNTSNIIRKYEEKYPDIIKPIYQRENQYSKHVNTNILYIYPKVQGKYIALCEGDDFWTDPHKMQTQTDFLEAHQDYSLCFHAVKIVDTKKNFSGRYIGPYRRGSKTYSINKLGRGGFIHMNSMLLRSELLKVTLPPWYVKKYGNMGGDFRLAIYLGAVGKTYYIDKVMSAYRIGVENSLMTKMKQSYSIQDSIKYHELRNSIIDDIDVYYDYKFHYELEEVKLQSDIQKLILENYLDNNLPKTKSSNIYKQLDLKTKSIMHIKYYFPEIYHFMKSISHELRFFIK